MTRLRTTMSLVLTSWLVGGCGRPGEAGSLSQSLDQLLAKGRRVATLRPQGEAGGGFLLSSAHGLPGLVGFKTASDSERVLWALFDTGTMPAVAPEDLASDALAYLGSQEGFFMVPRGDLETPPRLITINERLVSVNFMRSWRGLPVRDAFVEVIFARDEDGRYRLREVVNGSHGDLRVTNDGATAADWSDLLALTGEAALSPVSQQRLVYGKASGPERFSHVLATEFAVREELSGTLYTVTIEDGSKALLEAFSSSYAAAQPLQASVFKRTYLDTERARKPLPITPVVTAAGEKTSDLDGLVDLGTATDVTLRLQSPRVQVIARQGNVPYQVRATVGTDGAYLVNPTGDDLTALNTYTSILEVNRFTRRHLSPQESSFLGASTATRFNVRGNCNAFYDTQTSSISLFAAGNGCANVAQINDVIYHEWGHGLDNFTGRTVGIRDGAFSEGIGDIVAAYLTGSSVTAPGFLVNDATGIRQLENTLKYPDDQGEVHFEGQIIGGAFWDLRKAMIARHGAVSGALKAEELFFRHLVTTDAYLQSYQAVLRLDDNDGNPATKSPNHCLINSAFAAHGLAEAENCTDDAKPAAVPKDETLVVAVQKQDAAGLVLMASTAKGDKLTACLGSKESCLASGKEDLTFVKEGQLGAKTVFLAEKPLALKPMDVVTVVAKDRSGKPVGTRTIKITTK